MNLTMIAACRPRRSSAFDPLSTSPYILLDAQRADSRPLKTGGLAAGFMDLAATQENPGSASDAAQATGASQPLYLAHEAGANYLYLPGVAGNYATVPHSAAITIPGDLDLRVFVQLPDYAPTTVASRLISKRGVASNYDWYFDPSAPGGQICFYDGSLESSSTVAVGLTNGEDAWLRVTYAVNNGSGRREVRHYKSANGSDWTQIGASIDAGPAGPLPTNSGDNLGIGSFAGGGSSLRGAIHRAIIKNGIDGTTVLDINFAAAPHRASSFIATTGQTVTINATGNNPAVIVGYPMLRYDGIDDFMSGTFASAITGGRMFAVFSIHDYVSDTGSRLFSTASDAGFEYQPDGAIWGYQNSGTGLAIYKNPTFAVVAGAWVPSRKLVETQFSGISNSVAINNGTPATDTTDSSGIASTRFRLAAGFLGQHAAIDLEALYLLPASASAADVASMRSYLNTRHGLGLTLP